MNGYIVAMYQMTLLTNFHENLCDERLKRYLENLESHHIDFNVSGCIVFRKDVAIQVMEGTRPSLQKRIQEYSSEDSVLSSIRLLWEGSTTIRIFELWYTIGLVRENDTSENRRYINNVKTLSELVVKSTACVALFWAKVHRMFTEEPQKITLVQEA